MQGQRTVLPNGRNLSLSLGSGKIARKREGWKTQKSLGSLTQWEEFNRI